MFIAHFGIGFGAKKFAPAVSLGALLIASQFLDLLWPSLLVLDLEHVKITPGITAVNPMEFTHYPISHSLLMVLLWSLLLGLLTYLLLKSRKYSLVIFLCVLSHWFLDFLVHRPDLPLMPGDSPVVGLGLWNYPVLTALAEALFFLGGVWIYLRATTAKNKFGKYGFVSLVVFLILIQVANTLGPAPTDVDAIAWAGQLQWLIVIFALFVDRNRKPVGNTGLDLSVQKT